MDALKIMIRADHLVIEKYCKMGIGILLMGVQTVKGKIQEICTSYNVMCKTSDEISFANKKVDYRNMKYSLAQQTIADIRPNLFFSLLLLSHCTTTIFL